MTVVAEGAETADQYDELRAVGCESCQGYYFARPVSAANLDTLTTDRAINGAVYLP